MIASILSPKFISSPVGSACRNLNMSKVWSANMSTVPTPIIELREYEIHPDMVVPYLNETALSSDVRKILTPLRVFSVPESGGKLNVATHLYHFAGGYAERDDRRKDMGNSNDWKEYLSKARRCIQSQKSTIFVEAPLVKETEGVIGLEMGYAETSLDMKSSTDCILELRRYQLKLGYDTVPNFLKLYGEGLPSKLNAPDTDPSTSLITVMYTELGSLNEVIELWRHGDGTKAMELSRVAARGASEWRTAISEIAGLAVNFTSTIHKPVSWSPIK